MAVLRKIDLGKPCFDHQNQGGSNVEVPRNTIPGIYDLDRYHLQYFYSIISSRFEKHEISSNITYHEIESNKHDREETHQISANKKLFGIPRSCRRQTRKSVSHAGAVISLRKMLTESKPLVRSVWHRNRWHSIQILASPKMCKLSS